MRLYINFYHRHVNIYPLSTDGTLTAPWGRGVRASDHKDPLQWQPLNPFNIPAL
jgi:hypothetical protein